MDARAAFEAFLTPPRVSPLSLETRLLDQATGRRVRLGPNGYARGGGQEVQTYVWGDESAPAVLFAHGWGGNAGNHAAGIKAVLAAGGRAVAFDAPGHGRSEGTLSCAPAFAWAMEAVAQEVAGGAVRGIIAHSLGGGAACIALGRQGLQAERVVLLAASCAVEPVLRDFTTQMNYPPELAEATQQFAAGEFTPDETSALPNAARLGDIPALLMHDPEDREIGFFHSEAIAGAWPGAELVPVPKVGHRSILRAGAVVSRACGFVLG